MGLHAHIHQLDREVTIALSGRFRSPEQDQLHEILLHFHRRGCRSFVLDVRHLDPQHSAFTATLPALPGYTAAAAAGSIPDSAIRLLADSPAA